MHALGREYKTMRVWKLMHPFHCLLAYLYHPILYPQLWSSFPYYCILLGFDLQQAHRVCTERTVKHVQSTDIVRHNHALDSRSVRAYNSVFPPTHFFVFRTLPSVANTHWRVLLLIPFFMVVGWTFFLHTPGAYLRTPSRVPYLTPYLACGSCGLCKWS